MNKRNIIILFVLISLLYFATRLYHIESFPHYDNDESFYHQLSLNIKEGKFYQDPSNHKWYADIYGLKYIPSEHPPLHFLMTAPFVTKSIISIRIVNVVLNYIILILIFWILYKLICARAALLGAFIWTIYPFAIYMNRWNYPQTSLALFTLVFVLCCIYKSPIGAVIGITTATLSQYCGALLIIPYFLVFKKKGIKPLILPAIVGVLYLSFAIDRFVLQQVAPTLARFVFLIPVITTLVIVGVPFYLIFIRRRESFLWSDIKHDIKSKFNKIHPILWYSLYFYLIIYYLVISKLDIYAWYTYGVNIFYIGVIGLFYIEDKTIAWSFIVLQTFMLVLNRGDHVSVMVQPLIIIGFVILTHRVLFIPSLRKLTNYTAVALIIIAFITLVKVQAYVPEDSENLDSFYGVINITNSFLTPTTCIMSMTKFSTQLNTNCKSDILIPVAYEHGDAVYRHFHDKDIFNYNVSYLNMQYVLVKQEGMDFLKQWGEKNNASMHLAIGRIVNWPNITVNNITIYFNPLSNQTYGKFGEHRVYYRKPDKEGKAIIEILNWNEITIKNYTLYENPKFIITSEVSK